MSKPHRLDCLLSFAVTFLIMSLVLLVRGCAPFGDISLAFEDGNIQYLDFFGYLHDVLHGTNNITYSFSIGLGQTGIGIFAYYLASPLNLFVFFFEKEQLNVFFNLLVVLKLSLSALMMHIYLSRRFANNISNIFTVILSVAYGLMQFNIAQAGNVMWLDGVYMLPLMMLGIYELIHKDKYILLPVSTALAILFSWYSAGMNCIFAALWFLFELALYNVDKRQDIKTNLKISIKCLGMMLIAFMLSSALMIPNILNLKNGRGDSFDPEVFRFVLNGNPTALLRGYVLGARSVSIADLSLYCGSFVVINMLLYWFNDRCLKRKLIVFAFGVVIYLMYFWQPLVAVFSLLKESLSYWCRYSYLAVFFLIFVAAINLSKYKNDDYKHYEIAVAGCFSVLVIVVHYAMPVWETKLVWKTVILMMASAVVLFIGTKFDSWRQKLTLVMVLLFTAFELGYNAYLLIPYYSYYEAGKFFTYTARQESLLEDINEGSEFYRINIASARNLDATFNSQSEYNAGMLYGCNTISTYSSAPENATLELLERLGYRTEGKCITVVNTSIAPVDTLLGVRYVVCNRPISGFELYRADTDINRGIYENPYYIPLGIRYVPHDYGLAENLFDYINNLYSELLGEPVEVFKPAAYNYSDNESQRHYSILMPEDTDYLYGNIPYTRTLMGVLNVNNQYDQAYATWLSPSVFEIPQEDGTAIVDFAGLELSSLGEAQFYAFDEAQMTDISERLRDATGSITHIDNGNVIYDVHSDVEGEHLFLAIPRSDGWMCSVNGKRVEISVFADSLMSIPLEKGSNHIELKYKLPGAGTGILLTVIGTVALALVIILQNRKQGTETREA